MKANNLLIITTLFSMIFFIESCYKSKSSYNNTATTNKVMITNSGYSPPSLSVATGSTVTWTNNDSMVHTVTTSDGSINSGDIMAGASYSKTFSTAGTLNYYDAHNKNMTGMLIVTASTGSGY
jgi:plastocyanin